MENLVLRPVSTPPPIKEPSNPHLLMETPVWDTATLKTSCTGGRKDVKNGNGDASVQTWFYFIKVMSPPPLCASDPPTQHARAEQN